LRSDFNRTSMSDFKLDVFKTSNLTLDVYTLDVYTLVDIQCVDIQCVDIPRVDIHLCKISDVRSDVFARRPISDRMSDVRQTKDVSSQIKVKIMGKILCECWKNVHDDIGGV